MGPVIVRGGLAAVDNGSPVHSFAGTLPGMLRIEADPGGLRATAAALQDVTAVAEEVHRGARALATAAAATGSSLLSHALDDFRHTWAYGLGLVVDDADLLGRVLDQAATAYDRTDTEIGRACRP
jgi:hypothetical protein